MSRRQSPEQVGETIALDEWQCRGRALVTLHSTYARAVYRLEKECQAPEALAAFNRRLAQLAAAAPGILRPWLSKTPRSRRKRS